LDADHPQTGSFFHAESQPGSEVGDRLRFPLILPDRAEVDMKGRCFDWYHETETARDSGEAASIAAITRAAISHFDTDPGRVFIVGQSAGGAMTAALLAAYPDLFARAHRSPGSR
jgi:poly(3-hydroxybutyrate) depolymerase